MDKDAVKTSIKKELKNCQFNCGGKALDVVSVSNVTVTLQNDELTEGNKVRFNANLRIGTSDGFDRVYEALSAWAEVNEDNSVKLSNPVFVNVK